MRPSQQQHIQCTPTTIVSRRVEYMQILPLPWKIERLFPMHIKGNRKRNNTSEEIMGKYYREHESIRKQEQFLQQKV